MTPSEEALVEAGGIVRVSIDGNINEWGSGSLGEADLLWDWQWVVVVAAGRRWPTPQECNFDVPTTPDEWRKLVAAAVTP